MAMHVRFKSLYIFLSNSSTIHQVKKKENHNGKGLNTWGGVRFSKTPETFRARKAIFSSFACKNGEVYTLEPSCIKRTSDRLKNTCIKQFVIIRLEILLWLSGCDNYTGPSSKGPPQSYLA